MPKDRSERKMYRKSPGRQYGYEYDPLRSRSGRSQSGQSGTAAQEEQWPTRGESDRTNTAMAQRPDLRRTRQLLRQNIIASKNRPSVEEEQPEYDQEQQTPNYEEEIAQRRSPAPHNRPQQYIPTTRELTEAGEALDVEPWQEFDVDPDAGYEDLDPLDMRLGYAEIPQRTPTRAGQRQPTRVPARSARPIEPEYYDDEEYEYEEDEPPARRRPRKKNVSRRGLLFGLGVVAAGGAGVAAYELVPKIPQLANDVGVNIEKQLQDAFNRGVAQGANTVRQDFVTSLESLEGFSLDGAINAAKLTRVAYDTFVSPLIKFGAEVAGDFLTTMDRAFITARGWLRNIGQDNTTLAAIQNVLDTWITQVNNMPKQLDAITNADLDGAQAYLRALDRKSTRLNSSHYSRSRMPSSA